MNKRLEELICRLEHQHTLETEEYACIIEGYSPEAAEYLAQKAVRVRKSIYGSQIYIRGLIEIGNVCRNDCLYCGIRRSNRACERYRLSKEQILECCRNGYELGFRTFVLQGGEDGGLSAGDVCETVRAIKYRYPDTAVTLSLGEYERADYEQMFTAGADRYLLRHETANKALYEKLHPKGMSFEKRMRCLTDLKEIGFQTGCGFMVSPPFQTAFELAEDLKFVERFSPDMCGIGPFIPHKDTPFRDEPAGGLELTVYLLSVLRLIKPNLLLPATTALGTIHPFGREMGILAGANVVMPNLSPPEMRKKYMLYDNKIGTGEEAAEGLEQLKRRMEEIGYEIVVDRGDIKKTEGTFKDNHPEK